MHGLNIAGELVSADADTHPVSGGDERLCDSLFESEDCRWFTLQLFVAAFRQCSSRQYDQFSRSSWVRSSDSWRRRCPACRRSSGR
eukprot:580857-Pleurochrysis_carterae.AAC.3